MLIIVIRIILNIHVYLFHCWPICLIPFFIIYDIFPITFILNITYLRHECTTYCLIVTTTLSSSNKKCLIIEISFFFKILQAIKVFCCFYRISLKISVICVLSFTSTCVLTSSIYFTLIFLNPI